MICVVRTAPSYALYLGGSENELLDRVLRRLAQEDAQTVVLARNDDRRRAARAVSDRFVVPEQAIHGSVLVAFADALVSAGGTMNREAAVLGTPVWSIFEGASGAWTSSSSPRGDCGCSPTLNRSSCARSRRGRRRHGYVEIPAGSLTLHWDSRAPTSLVARSMRTSPLTPLT